MKFDNNIHKSTVSNAFSRQSEVFDKIYSENLLSEYMRKKFREELLKFARPESRILELNCGTGMDTIYLASKGFDIVATDNAPGMLAKISEKVKALNLEHKVHVVPCDFEQIGNLQQGTFDHIYSNFSGLNCTRNLADILQQLKPLLNPGGKVSLVLMPMVCPWELIMICKGMFRTAFRRFGKNGANARIENVHFRTWYYNPSYVKRVTREDYDVLSLKGICITVPPPFIENFVERYPKLFAMLERLDKKIEYHFPFTYCCDQYMITLQLK